MCWPYIIAKNENGAGQRAVGEKLEEKKGSLLYDSRHLGRTGTKIEEERVLLPDYDGTVRSLRASVWSHPPHRKFQNRSQKLVFRFLLIQYVIYNEINTNRVLLMSRTNRSKLYILLLRFHCTINRNRYIVI